MTKYIKYISFIFMITLVVSFCKKEKDIITISGSINDPNFNKVSDNTKVTLKVKKIESGTFSSVFSTIDTKTTDVNGTFEFSFEKLPITDYKITFRKENYVDLDEEIDPKLVEKTGSYNQEYNIYPEAFIDVDIKNRSPFNDDDKINFKFVNPPKVESCCNDNFYTFIGRNTDTIISCRTYGNQNLILNWITIKDNVSIIHNDTVWCKAFETKNYAIYY